MMQVIFKLFENYVYYLLLCFYYPLYLFGLLLVKTKIILNELKLHSGWLKIYRSSMKPLSKRSKVCDVGEISTEEEIDFVTHRSAGYLERMTLWTARELSKLATGQQTIALISDNQLCYVLLNTVYAHSLHWDETRSMYCLDLSDMNKMILFEGFYWEVKKVFIEPTTCKVVIVTRDDREYRSDCSLRSKPDYNLAKLHLQICMSYHAPGLAHNYVHFVFPSAVCLAAKRLLDEKSVLFKLLSPHFRFMERLNYQALRVCHASSNRRTIFDRFFCFWKTFPITKEQFTTTMEDKLNGHYHGHVKEDADNHSDPDSAKQLEKDSNHPLFPPTYVSDISRQKIPYLAFLNQYYDVVKGFVAEIAPFVDRQEWTELRQAISKHVPGFENVDMIEGLSTFIHLVAVEHSADHQSYYDEFAKEHGCICIRSPFEPFSNAGFWKEICRDSNLCVEAIKRNPTKLISQVDVMRMRCFMNVFVDFIPSPTCDLSLIKTSYNFATPAAEIAERKFISQLRCLDGNLKDLRPSYVIPRTGRDQPRSTGMQLVKLRDFVRSNCY